MLQESIIAVLIVLFRVIQFDQSIEPPEQPYYQDLPAVVTWYDPSKCLKPDATPEDMINCDSDPEHVADGTEITEDLYGVTAACDRRLLGRIIKIGDIGTFRCKDTGGMIEPTWSKHHQRWVLYFDVMLHENPYWNYWLIEDWSILR